MTMIPLRCTFNYHCAKKRSFNHEIYIKKLTQFDTYPQFRMTSNGNYHLGNCPNNVTGPNHGNHTPVTG